MSQQTYGPGVVEEQGLSDWTFRDDALHARFATGDFATGLALVNLVGESAEEMDHHPDLELRYAEVAVTTWSHDVGGVTDRDVRLARAISEHASAQGVRPA